MIHFILGIFTGITLCVIYGGYLGRQIKKKAESTPPPKEAGIGVYIDGRYVVGLKSTSLLDEVDPPYPVTVVRSLDDLLQDAIDREDFKEAARLWDLMNKA